MGFAGLLVVAGVLALVIPGRTLADAALRIQSGASGILTGE